MHSTYGRTDTLIEISTQSRSGGAPTEIKTQSRESGWTHRISLPPLCSYHMQTRAQALPFLLRTLRLGNRVSTDWARRSLRRPPSRKPAACLLACLVFTWTDFDCFRRVTTEMVLDPSLRPWNRNGCAGRWRRDRNGEYVFAPPPAVPLLVSVSNHVGLVSVSSSRDNRSRDSGLFFSVGCCGVPTRSRPSPPTMRIGLEGREE